MTYHMDGLGAGPGPIKTYYVDLPFPWGKDTEVKVPLEAVLQDVLKLIPVDALAKQFVDAGWPELRDQAGPDLPQLLDQAVGPKWNEAQHLVNQTLSDVDAIASRVTRGVFIAAALTLAGTAFLMWRMKR